MASCLTDLAEFCASAGVPAFAPTLQLFQQRAVFHKTFVDSSSVVTAITAMLATGFGTPELGRALRSTTPPVNLSLWLRAFFWQTFAEQFQLEAQARASPEDTIKLLTKELLDGEALLQQACGDTLEDFLKDVSSLRLLFQTHVSSRGRSQVAVKEALLRVTGPEMEALRAAVGKHEVWVHVIASAHGALQHSAQSSLAATHLERAQKYVRDDRLPDLSYEDSPSGRVCCYSNVGSIIDGTAVASLVEGLDLVAEAYVLWEDGPPEEAVTHLGGWADDVVKKVAVTAMPFGFLSSLPCKREL